MTNKVRQVAEMLTLLKISAIFRLCWILTCSREGTDISCHFTECVKTILRPERVTKHRSKVSHDLTFNAVNVSTFGV